MMQLIFLNTQYINSKWEVVKIVFTCARFSFNIKIMDTKW